jgi:hypothetical protein
MGQFCKLMDITSNYETFRQIMGKHLKLRKSTQIMGQCVKSEYDRFLPHLSHVNILLIIDDV